MHETHILETKNVVLYIWRGGGKGSEKEYCLYIHENVDIFGWPVTYLIVFASQVIRLCFLMHMSNLIQCQ